jgi:hypothetical protein
METSRIAELKISFNELKKDAQEIQKKGLPFMMASVVIWSLILGIQFLNINVTQRNLLTFTCSVILMPLAYLFSKLVKADIFKKTDNPVNKLGFVFTMNQMLYILIVMWAYSERPEAMLMLYAMVFGAHLLPFSWIYDTKAYAAVSIIETIGALIITLIWGSRITAAFMITMQIIISTWLYLNIRKADKN